jgi:two-component system, OmpR family, response regulator
MTPTRSAKPSDSDVFALTAQGIRELNSAGTSLAARELEILVLIDGTASVAEIAVSATGMAPAQVHQILADLLEKNLIAKAEETSVLDGGFLAIPVPAGFFKNAGAQPEAKQGVASLRKKGYYVRIARRAVRLREPKQGWQPTVLVVDDDADVVKLIRTYFGMEGFVVRQAGNRAEIVAAFRQPPAPDLVVLDVNLPDASGFDVLVRLRQHAVLKSTPVLMLTAEATREAVLKALQAGADGFITKPFEPDQLVGAVKEVLGVPR